MSDDSYRRPPPLPPRLPLKPPRLENVRPGVERPQTRPHTTGIPAVPPPLAPRPVPGQIVASPAADLAPPPIGQHSRSAPVRQRRPLLIGVTVLLMLAVLGFAGASAYLVLKPPTAYLTQEVIAQVKARTGRDLTVGGPVRLKVFPRFVLSAQDVSLSTAPNMTGEPLATIAELDLQLRLLPLLWRQIEIDGVTMRRPVIDLRTDAAGRRSWDFAALDQPRLIQYADAGAQPQPGDASATLKDFVENASDPSNPSPQSKARLLRLEKLRLGDLRIEDGTIRSSDARTGVKREASAVAASVSFESLASPVLAKGRLTYLAQPLAFDFKLSSIKALVEDRAAKLEVSITGQPGEFSYDGTVTTRSAMELEGGINAKVPSLKALAAWLWQPLPEADGYGPLSVDGKIRTAENTVSLADVRIALDDHTATGLLALDVSGARPRITANLRFSALDINRYLPDPGAGAATSPNQPGSVRPAAAPTVAPGGPAVGNSPVSIEDTISRGGPKVKGYTRRAGWSSDRIPIEALGLADVDARLFAGRLRYHDIETTATSATVTLRNRQLRLNFDDVQLYQGRGRGFIQVDGGAAVPVVGFNFGLEGAQIAGLLKDAAGIELLQGKAKLSLAIGAQGASQAELIASSNGKADLTVTEGALGGYNISAGLRGLTKGSLAGFGMSPSEKTDFSEMAATFTVTNGVASSQDIRLTSPQIVVSGTGQVLLPQQSVDLVLKPKLTASLDGRGGTDAFTGIEVPLKVQGPWAQPSIRPDGGVLFKDPAKTIEAAKSVAKQLKDSGAAKKIGEALRGLVNKPTGDGGEGKTDTGKAKDFLNKLFNKD